MVVAERNEKSARNGAHEVSDPTLEPAADYEIHAEARGPHWVGWISRGGSGAPDRAILLVAATEEEAQARARAWIAARRRFQPPPA